MDMAKSFYAYTIQQDQTVAGTVARYVWVQINQGSYSVHPAECCFEWNLQLIF